MIQKVEENAHRVYKTSFEQLAGLESLAERYDAFLVDQFGVLLHGSGTYPQAPDSLLRLSELGKRVVLLSNSGKRSGPNIQRLLSLGFARSSFETVLTSGEVAHSYLLNLAEKSFMHGAPVLVIAEQPEAHLEGLPLTVAQHPQDAQLVLIAGSDPRHEQLDSYRSLLAPLAERGIDCLCTNPDAIRLSGSGTTFGPGAVAEFYESLGGMVHWIGKPFPMMYEAARDWLGTTDASGIVCIGDSPAHDIAGAQGAGMDSALIASGVHADETLDAIRIRCLRLGARPNYVLERFAFKA